MDRRAANADCLASGSPFPHRVVECDTRRIGRRVFVLEAVTRLSQRRSAAMTKVFHTLCSFALLSCVAALGLANLDDPSSAACTKGCVPFKTWGFTKFRVNPCTPPARVMKATGCDAFVGWAPSPNGCIDTTGPCVKVILYNNGTPCCPLIGNNKYQLFSSPTACFSCTCLPRNKCCTAAGPSGS